ncbi:MAG: enoyl-CoA hydratase/isomerase family protein [Pseudomonadota bacterium]
MTDTLYLVDKQGDGTTRLTLNRPDIHNAFDDALIAALTETLADLAADPSVRVLVLTGAGKSFSAGADLGWMRRMAEADEETNRLDALALAGLMHRLNDFPKPTVALVNGAAIGGGVGLVACCDIAIASASAVFALSEVRLGLMPAAISPFVLAAIGERAARRYFLTAERFDAGEAKRIGLVHDTAPADALEAAGAQVVHGLLKAGPNALAACKTLIHDMGNAPIDRSTLEETAKRIAALRASPEGREGIGAFLEKRSPAWIGR